VAARLKERYTRDIAPELMKQFGYKNVMQIPKVEKVVINMGVGDATQDARAIDGAVAELAVISGQHPSIRAAHKSVSNFKLRAGVNIGCMTTLRGRKMYEFIDRLVNVAIPRIRDFRGISPRGFDNFGNFTLGIRDQSIFPEVDMDKLTRTRGMNVTFVISNASTADESRELLRKMGMPFAAM
jgi:large subunit ribosomal protein L5